MILTGIVVFLFGTTVSAGPFMPYMKEPTEIVITKHSSADKDAEYYPSSGGSPFVSNYIQKGTNVFFKPQFMLSAGQMPPQIQTMISAIEKDDCKDKLPMGPIPMIMEEPLRVVEQEIIAPSRPIIKEVIEINPIENIELTPAEPPRSEILVMELPQKPVTEEKYVMVPEAPVLTPYVPPPSVIFEVEKSKLPPPPASVLPPFEMPKIEIVEQPIPCPPEEIVEGSIEEQEIPEVAEILIKDIPHPPELPPFTMPALPVVVKEEVYMRLPEPEMPCEELNILEEVKPIIPEAPVLTPYVPVEVPKPISIEEIEISEPVSIPTAPELPPFVIPKLPVVIEEPAEVPCPPSEVYVPEIIVSPPEAPVLPPLEIPELPVKVEVEETVVPCDDVEVVEQPLIIPEAPVLTPIEMPTPVIVEKPIIVEVQRPAVIPTAPVLQPIELPEAHLVIEESFDTVAPCPPENNFGHQRLVIESEPVDMLAPYMFPKLSITESRISKPVVLTSASEHLGQFYPIKTEKYLRKEHASYARDIVVERILPKVETNFVSKSAKVPVSRYLTPVRYSM